MNKPKLENNPIKRALLLGAGFILVGLAIIGLFVPVMPSLPFLIIASICFSRSSKHFYNLLANNKWVGPQIKKYQEENGISLKTKILLVLSQAGGIGIAIIFVDNLLGQILLIALAIGFTIYILSLKTLSK